MFGPHSGNQITAEIDIRFDFEYEGLRALGKPSFMWQVVFNFDSKASLTVLSSSINQSYRFVIVVMAVVSRRALANLHLRRKGLGMATRDDFLRLVWDEIINGPMTGPWIDNSIAMSRLDPQASFADAGDALARLVANGADRRDLSLAVRFAIYEAVFSLLYMLDDPGVDGGDVFMLQDSLLSADPSGMEGRPGSAP
jgi:hypothetical protein